MFKQININAITGSQPYDIYVCNSTYTTCIPIFTINNIDLPFEFIVPSPYDIPDTVYIKLIDSDGCEYKENYFIGPCSPTPTPTTTPTPTPTPTNLFNAYLFIEPLTANTLFSTWMSSQFVDFQGFSNGVNTASNQGDFNAEFNAYISSPDWGVNVPSIRTSPISIITGGFDIFGNPIIAYTFQTHEVPTGLEPGYAWYTWMVPTGGTNGMIMSEVGVNSLGYSNALVNTNMNSLIYQFTVDYTGGVNIPNGTYRVYTTFLATQMRIIGQNNIYFRGGTLI